MLCVRTSYADPPIAGPDVPAKRAASKTVLGAPRSLPRRRRAQFDSRVRAAKNILGSDSVDIIGVIFDGYKHIYRNRRPGSSTTVGAGVQRQKLAAIESCLFALRSARQLGHRAFRPARIVGWVRRTGQIGRFTLGSCSASKHAGPSLSHCGELRARSTNLARLTDTALPLPLRQPLRCSLRRHQIPAHVGANMLSAADLARFRTTLRRPAGRPAFFGATASGSFMSRNPHHCRCSTRCAAVIRAIRLLDCGKGRRR